MTLNSLDALPWGDVKLREDFRYVASSEKEPDISNTLLIV